MSLSRPAGRAVGRQLGGSARNYSLRVGCVGASCYVRRRHARRVVESGKVAVGLVQVAGAAGDQDCDTGWSVVFVFHAAGKGRHLRKLDGIARCAHWWNPPTWLAFIFWELRTIFAAVGNDGQSDWKATVIIVVFEILAVFGLTDAASVYLGHRLN